ncbi:MAG: hypothetical protein MJ084_01830 [Saccharofermentans sp.]|nr:hypothetical protein [Saccharofermentans sp.]
MGRKRTQFTVVLNQDPAPFIQRYVAQEGFVAAKYGREDVYAHGNAMVGYKYLKYRCEGTTLTIYCWAGSGMPISGDAVRGAAVIRPYYASITDFIRSLNPASVNEVIVNEKEVNSVAGDSMTSCTDPSIAQFAQAGEEKNRKAKSVMSEIGFWASIAGVVLMFLGVAIGGVVYVFDIYAAIQGFQVGKKAKSIVTLILSAVSSIGLIVILVMSAR